MNADPYRQLADRLNELPNGFPPTPDGAELKLLMKLFTPGEARLAAALRLSLSTADEILARVSPPFTQGDEGEAGKTLKGMARNGLIHAGRTERGIGYGLMPFVVGIYEMQISGIEEELPQLFGDDYSQAFGQALSYQPQFHRVVPIGETIRMDMEVHPFESATEIINQAKAWGVMDCICRKQKALIGEPCQHPLETCMVLSPVEGTFDHSSTIRALSQVEAIDKLHEAAKAGLVHTVSNNEQGTYYICNCCTCSCGILRGMAEMGIANVVARSVFVNTVNQDLCMACETCLDYCQFDALELENGIMCIDQASCVGCGVCVPACPEDALKLIRRPIEEILPIPRTEQDWMEERARSRGIDLDKVL